ncbi:MAG TPA: M23 family metallopeptidase [Dyella sp.]|uniref:M23 family metallopeptidase n=1 Tax=Dyella sp. TaxID=1869338 RepID=UPI002D77EB19|nr:M23 family metallopeptidase [Dyella sp.]HET6555008.1 M23 family metallopeptidase [Dyella sp.]
MPLHRNTTQKTGRSLAIAVVVCAGVFGCATVDQKFGNDAWYQKTREGTAKAADVSTKAVVQAADASRTMAAEAYQRMQKYAAERDLLKTFTDASEHSESVVLEVLHRQQPAKPAVGGAGTRAGKGGKTGTGRASGPGGAAGTAPPTSVAAAPTTPDQYTGSLRWPVDACIISSRFGARWGKMHKGLDLAAETGEPVYAIAAGTVIYAGNGLRGYGNVVILRHDRNLTSLYAHNSELKVKQGDTVVQGQLISLLGSTGHSTGPHVHFEIREGDVAVDPMLRLPKSKFADLIDPEPDTRVASAIAR